jgi:hypothetical protein
MALSVIFDHAQPRLEHDRIAVVAAGVDLNGQYFQDTWIDPITKTLMLRPGPLYPEWYTSNSGLTAKLAPGDLTATDPDAWYTAADYKLGDVAAGPWIASRGVAPGGLITNTTWFKNRAMYVSCFAYGAGDNFELVSMGWNPDPTYLESVALRLYSSGDMEVWKNGDRVGLYNISGALVGDQKTNVNIDLLLIPCRRRELLVVSRQGNGFSHIFEDIAEDDEAPIITPEAKFWVNFAQAKAQVQIAAINFPGTGYATSEQYQLGDAPGGTRTLETFTNKAFSGGSGKAWMIYGDPSFVDDETTTKATLIKADNTGAFVANGTNKDCRIKVTINDGNLDPITPYTPFIYGAQVAYASTNADTDASEEVTVDSYCEELSIDVPDDASDITFRVQLLRPDALQAADVAKLKRINNRPAKLERSGIVWIDGQGESPSFEQSTTDNTQRLVLEFRDRWKSLETYMFKDRVPLDGINLVDALKFILKRVGLTDSDFDMDPVDFIIEAIPGPEAGDFNVVIKVGDTAADWVQRLIENYAATYEYGFRPSESGVKFIFKAEATLSSVDFVYELWPTIQEAIDAGKSREEAYKYVYKEYEEETLPPAANDIRVTGWDPRARRAIQSHYPDLDSQDPTLPPSSRPDNWMGEKLLFGIVDGSITSQAVCDRVAEQCHDRLTPVEVVGRIKCQLMIQANEVPVWRTHDIWLHGKGRYRVRSFGCDVEKQPKTGDTWEHREAEYCLTLKVAA